MAKIAAAYGRAFMPWQRYVADVALEVDADGRFVYKLVVITVPRQSGKTTAFGAVLDHRALVIPRARTWFTMQSAKDAVDWLTNEHWPLLAPFGAEAHLRRMAGSEHIRWKRSAGLIRPFPPTPAGLHGKVSDLVVVDECWKFDPIAGHNLDQAIVPTQATRPNAQVWKLSTAGDAGSVWWQATTEAGRAAVEAGRDSGVCYFEWSCPPDLDPTDPSSWPIYHPAYGRTIGDEAMRAALDQMGPEGFARAYGNRWVSSAARVIPVEAWRRTQAPDIVLPEPGSVALGFDVAIDRSDAAIVAVWRDGPLACVEVADHRPGVGWVVDRLAELVEHWRPVIVAYDKAGPALDVADAAERAGLTLLPLQAREYAAACAGFLDAIAEDPPRVRIRPHHALDLAAASAVYRPLGDAWAWGRRQSSGSLSSLTAATVALWGFDHRPIDIGTFRVF